MAAHRRKTRLLLPKEANATIYQARSLAVLVGAVLMRAIVVGAVPLEGSWRSECGQVKSSLVLGTHIARLAIVAEVADTVAAMVGMVATESGLAASALSCVAAGG